jgi:hypothetical protein
MRGEDRGSVGNWPRVARFDWLYARPCNPSIPSERFLLAPPPSLGYPMPMPDRSAWEQEEAKVCYMAHLMTENCNGLISSMTG